MPKLLIAFACCLLAGRAAEVCRTATLRNGRTVPYSRHEASGAAARLWLCGDGIEGYVEVPAAQIESFDPVPAPVTAAPPQQPPPATAAAAGPPDIGSLIAGAATRNRIDPDFVASVVKAESGFNPAAVSRRGAAGLMQLMPGTAASLGVADAFDPAENLEAGTRYLRQMLELFDWDAIKALAAYNAGPARVERYGGVPPYRETRDYVSRVIRDYNRKKTGASD